MDYIDAMLDSLGNGAEISIKNYSDFKRTILHGTIALRGKVFIDATKSDMDSLIAELDRLAEQWLIGN